MQPATEHGFFFPPLYFLQWDDPDFVLVVHPSNMQLPCAPCLAQTPRALARGEQPSPLAHFPPSTAVFNATPSCHSVGAATADKAYQGPGVVFPALPFHTDGFVDARVRSAVPKGTMFDAENLGAYLWSAALWISAGHLHSVLATKAAPLQRGRGATFSETLACAVFSAQPLCARPVGAAVDRAGLAAMFLAERVPFAVGDVRAAVHHAHLLLSSPQQL